MKNPLNDGEQRVMRPLSFLDKVSKEEIVIIAERIDCDTPNVILRLPAGVREIHMSDSMAKDVSDRIQRALRMLPTSK